MNPITYDEKKKSIIQALFDHKGMQTIINTAAIVFNNPIFVNDKSFKILCKSNVLESDETTWKQLFPNNQMMPEDSKKVENGGVYKHILTKDEPIYGTFDFYPHPFLGCRIRDKEGMVAMATMIIHHSISKEDEELFKFLCQVLFYEILYTNQTAMQKVPYFNLIKDLIENTITEEEYTQRLHMLHLPSFPSMRTILIEYNDKPSLSLYYIQNVLVQDFPSSLSVIYENQIILILDATKYRESYFKDMVNGYAIHIGISRIYNNLFHLSNYYKQAMQAIRISEKMGMEAITYYENIVFYDLLSNCKNPMLLKEYIHPGIHALMKYDSTHSISLLHTLDVYLDNNQNIQKTSENLQIHRSSLYTRLEKIENLASIHLNNADEIFNLESSIKIMKYLK